VDRGVIRTPNVADAFYLVSRVVGERGSPMAGKGKGYPGWLRSYGIGFEFATAVAVFGLIGYWIDRKFDSSPWGVLVGTALGLTGGTYNLIKESLTAFRRLPKTHRRDDQPPDRSGKTERDRPDDGTPPNEP